MVDDPARQSSGGPATGGVPRPPLVFLLSSTVAGSFAMNMYVPSLPAIAADLEADAQTVQLTLTVFLFVFALSQLAYGPLADRYGRKSVMLAGLALFMVANVLAVSAQTIEWLLLARVIQAIGACGGMVVTRAMVRDAWDIGDSARIMAYLGMGGGVSSSLAPLLGGFLQSWTGDWRSNFVAMAVLTLLPMVILAVFVRETLQRREGRGSGLGGMVRDYGSLLRSPEYMLFASGAALMNATFFAFLALAPFILVNVVGASPERLGLVLIFITGGFFAGSLIVSRISSRFALGKLVLAGSLVCFAGIAAFAALALGGVRHELAISLPMLLFGVGNGAVLPPTGVIAVSLRPRIAATASALYGFASFALGSIGTVVAGFLSQNSTVPLALFMLALVVCAVASFSVALRKSGADGAV